MKRYIDIDYFKNVDTEEKAYWLGYICADGCVHRKQNKLSLRSKDKEVIIGFKNAVKTDYPVGKFSYLDKRTNKTYTSYSIQICNKTFISNIKNLGITENKTDFLTFPALPNNLRKAFILGLFDGDGCIFSRKNTIGISFISTREVLETIKTLFNMNFNTPFPSLQKVSENKDNVFKVTFYKKGEEILNWLYTSSLENIWLQRKKSHFEYLKRTLVKTQAVSYREVLVYNQSRHFVKSFSSIKEAAKFLNCSACFICSTLKLPNNTVKGHYVLSGNKYTRKIKKYDKK